MAHRPESITALSALESDDERRRWLAMHPRLRERGAVDELCQDVVSLLRVDLDEARRRARAARWLAEELDDDYCRGRSHRAMAIVLIQRRENAAALEQAEAALACFERIGDEREAAITRSSALHSLAHQGLYERALEWAASASAAFRRLDDRLRLARLEHNVGTLLARQDRFQEALSHYRSAYEAFRAIGCDQDVGIALRNIAVTLQSSNDFAAALDAYRQAREYCVEHDLPLLVVEIDYNVAYLHYLRGEYARALRLFEISRQSCDELGDEHHKALCDLDQSEIYLELNLVAEAARLAERGRGGFARLGMQYEVAKCLTNLAIARSRQGENARAMTLLSEAREIFGRERNRVWPAIIDLFRSRLLYAEQRLEEAGRLASRALTAFARSSLPSRVAMCEIQLARLALAKGAPEEARRRCAAALGALRDLQLPALEYQARVVSGKAEEALGAAAAAVAAYRKADSTLERLRSHLQSDELKISFLEDKLEVFEGLVWLGLEGEPTAAATRAAFLDIEKAKSRSLADLLDFRINALMPKSAGNGSFGERLRDLRRELNGYYRLIDRHQTEPGELSRDKVAELRRQAHSREQELLRRLRELQAADREYTSLQGGALVDLDGLRAALPADTVLVEYYFARGTVFAGLVGRDRLKVVPVSSVARVREIQRSLRYQLSKLLLGDDYVARFGDLLLGAVNDRLRALYDNLVAPLDGDLEGGHMVVVPHDFLHYVPFHALLRGDEYLIDRCSVSYAPSASVYYLCRSKRGARRERALVMGVADRRAPRIRREARAVADALPGAVLLLGEEASEESLRRLGPHCGLVHLATHGHFRRDNPMFSSIQLGGGRLSLFDLYDLTLDAELVVLSGCGTGLNEVRHGDELVGLTRGLLYAGARSVAVTLWDVNDETTTELMRMFYRELRAGGVPAQALRRAMLDLRESHPHPYHWAPFVLIGDPQGAWPGGESAARVYQERPASALDDLEPTADMSDMR